MSVSRITKKQVEQAVDKPQAEAMRHAEQHCRMFLHWWTKSGEIEVTEDNRLRVTPKSRLTPPARDFIKRHKEVLKALVRLAEALKQVAFKPDGYVYVLKAGDYYKIGRTTDIERRSSELKIQLPFKAELVHYIGCEQHVESECYWHKHFSQQRCNGEWFVLEEEQLEEVFMCNAMRGAERLW